MTQRDLSGFARIPIYAANPVSGGLDAGGCEEFRGGCGFQIVSMGELPRDPHLPLASRGRETGSHRRYAFTQLPDQDRLEVYLSFGCFPVSALERRLQARRLGPCGCQSSIVMLGLLQQSSVLVFTALELLRLRVAQLRAVDHEENEQLLAIPT